ncbi:hypothetical protein [Streptomyces sp. NPDC050145]|uniref:hypothetical protein n=1 Tax=Streptomyces sp. NPDC050145 TaxID=3365602 RepID=UPI00379D103C
MARPNTRKIDHKISDARDRLAAVQNRELTPLTGREKRKALSAMAAGSTQVVRGRSTSRADRRIDRVWDEAADRILTEIAELESERRSIVREAGDKKSARIAWW